MRDPCKQLLIFCLINHFIGVAIADNWPQTLKRVSSAVVSLHVDAVRAFDTKINTSSYATGFVVDAVRGIILTNRHVIRPGPVVASAIFENHEEIELTPIYRDPVHDFGFFKYNPKHLRFMRPTSLPLVQGKAMVGQEIRVVGNDAGEPMSILGGTLASIDRNAPKYGYGQYNDFNTFYLQSASDVSGGSSGSPVVDIYGDVVALNAGSNKKTSSSFFLPLDRIKYALHKIQNGQPISRGTLQTTFIYRTFDELRRLGLASSVEAILRGVGRGGGALVVDRVLPGGAGHDILKPGDIVIKVEQQLLADFAKLEAILDARVGRLITMTVTRDKRVDELTVRVADLHAITPFAYVSVSGAILHNLSYQQARHLHRPLTGVYVAWPGYMFTVAGVPRGAIIEQINDVAIANLNDFITAIKDLADGAEILVRYVAFNEPLQKKMVLITFDRKWYALEHCQRDDNTNTWPCTKLDPPTASLVIADNRIFPRDYKDSRINKLAESVVYIKFNMPYRINGIIDTNYVGMGLIIDAEKGLMVTDRNTVPTMMGDVKLIFADSVEIPAKVVFVHPLHNISVVQYDVKALPSNVVKNAEFSKQALTIGQQVWLIGFKQNQSLFSQQVVVESIDHLRLPLPGIPAFKETNLDTINLVNAPTSFGGVLTDDTGAVMALWASFAYSKGSKTLQIDSGIPIALVRDWVGGCCSETGIRALDVELKYIPLIKARKLGLTTAWLKKFDYNAGRRSVLAIKRIVSGTDAAKTLKNGDLILAINKQPVNDFRTFAKLTASESVVVSVVRDGTEQDVNVTTTVYFGQHMQPLVLWAGALLQPPHRSLLLQRPIKHQGVYISNRYFGSPASRYDLPVQSFITAVDGMATPDLTHFIKAVRQHKHRDVIKLAIMDKRGRPSVRALRMDKIYWPTEIISLENGEWLRQSLDNAEQDAMEQHVKPALRPHKPITPNPAPNPAELAP